MQRYLIAVLLISAVLLGLLIGCAPKSEDKVLAKVGDRTITLGDFETRYRPKTYDSEEEKKEEKMKILETIIEEKLFAIAGEKEGMKEEVEEGLKDYPDRLAVNQLYEEIVVKRAKASLLEMKKTYRMMGKELHGRHILVQTKEEADSIYKELRKHDAKNFAELAKLSLDTRTKDKAGDLDWFVWGRMNPDHQDIAYTLKLGEVSKPFETRMGWDILQIVDSREKKIEPFEEQKSIIENTIKRQKMNKIATDYLDGLKKRANITFDSSAVALLASKSPEIEAPNPFEPPPYPVLSEEEGNRVLVTTSSLGTMTIAEVLAAAEKQLRRPPLNSEDAIYRYVEGDLMNQLLIQQARRMHLHRSPEVLRNYNNTLDNRIAGEYRKAHIVPRTEIPEDEMMEHYKANSEQYSIPEKRTVHVVVLETNQEAEDIYKRVKRGANIKKLAEEKSIHYTKSREGKMGPLAQDRFPAEFKHMAFSLKLNEVCEPFKVKDGYCVMKLASIDPPGYQDFEMVKNRIKSEIINAEREKIRDELVEKLKQEIPVTIDEEVLLVAGEGNEKEEEKK
jgi:parvulin-like peptidyl-prolyl isomerase